MPCLQLGPLDVICPESIKDKKMHASLVAGYLAVSAAAPINDSLVKYSSVRPAAFHPLHSLAHLPLKQSPADHTHTHCRRGVLLSGVVFGALHNSGGRNPAFAAWASGVGCLYGTSFLLTHNIWVPAVAHATSNFISASVWKWRNTK